MRSVSHARVVMATLALCAAVSISSTTPYAQSSIGPGTVVLWTASAAPGDIHGDWSRIPDTTAAGGAALHNPNRSRSKVSPALASPANYFELRFDAAAGGPYRLWVRLRAERNATGNDSVHLQFSDSLDAAGRPVARIGTTQSADVILQNGSAGAKPQGWGWADNGWDAAGEPLYFAADGTHVVRVQQREDGAIVDQIVLSRDTYLTTRPGALLNDTTILADSGAGPSPPPPSMAGTTVLWAASISAERVFGTWQRVTDPTAAGGAALRNTNGGVSKIAPALASPNNYFETTFHASAATPYHIWVRMRAEGDSTANDSVHVQFSDSVNAAGSPTARIGTSSSAEFVLQAGPKGLAPHGWGWTENGWDTFGSHIYFQTTGTHTLRVQQREDGPFVDQIVISPDAFLTSAPGSRRDDFTILAERSPSANQPPTVAITAPANGATYTAPATILMTAAASDPENRLARVEFYSGSTRLGTDLAAPFSFSWASVAAGSYALTARAFDSDGGQASSSTVSVTVGSGNQPPTVSLTAPANGASFTAPATITMTAAAVDPENRMARVEFYAGTTRLATDTAAPYTYSWSSVPAGSYTLSALAFDADGASTRSANVTVNVAAATQTRSVVFQASTDHVALVTSYLLEVFAAGADPKTAPPLATSDLGKPAPNGSNEISVDRTSFLNGLAAGSYIATVSAIGPGGKGRSAPYSFTR